MRRESLAAFLKLDAEGVFSALLADGLALNTGFVARAEPLLPPVSTRWTGVRGVGVRFGAQVSLTSSTMARVPCFGYKGFWRELVVAH